MLPEFLNVDLDLESAKPLDKLVAELGDRVHVLHHGPLNDVPHYLALEIYEGEDNDPDSIINAFCQEIERLSAASKTAWKKCEARRFDIGVLSSTTSNKTFRGLRLDLQPKTLARVAGLGAQIVFTVYPKAGAPAATATKKKK
jgi:hypothetical protein